MDYSFAVEQAFQPLIRSLDPETPIFGHFDVNRGTAFHIILKNLHALIRSTAMHETQFLEIHLKMQDDNDGL